MEEEKTGTNWGCLILVIIGIIGSLIYFFTESPESIYSTGAGIIGLIVAVGIYFLFRHINSTNNGDKKSKVGCILSIIAIVGGAVLFRWLVQNGSLTYGVGAAFVVVLTIAIGIWAYTSFKDDK